MSAEDKSKLDDIFKNGLDVPDTHFEYDDQHWDDLEHLMDAGSRPRGIVYWLPRLGAVAAVLLLFLGWWMFKPVKQGQDPNTVAVVKHTTQPAQTGSEQTTTATTATNGGHTGNGTTATTPATKGESPLNSATPQAPVYANVPVKHNKVLRVTEQGQKPYQVKENVQPVAEQRSEAPENTLASTGNKTTENVASVNTNTTAPEKNVADEHIASAATANVIANVPAVQNPTPAQVKKPKVSNAEGFKPKFGLAMMLSPDVNGASSFQNAKVGTNVGLLLSVGVTKRFTVSTGAAYSKKPYQVDFADYHVGYKFKTDPQDVYADCRVLDIPINVDYKLYNKNRNSFSVGTGLSSYIMLRETYNYDYTDPNTVGPASFTVVNKNRHFLGVLNINATYERQLNSKFNIVAQPYLKMPLTGIGNSQVRLQSAGVALGVQWNINH